MGEVLDVRATYLIPADQGRRNFSRLCFFLLEAQPAFENFFVVFSAEKGLKFVMYHSFGVVLT